MGVPGKLGMLMGILVRWGMEELGIIWGWRWGVWCRLDWICDVGSSLLHKVVTRVCGMLLVRPVRLNQRAWYWFVWWLDWLIPWTGLFPLFFHLCFFLCFQFSFKRPLRSFCSTTTIRLGFKCSRSFFCSVLYQTKHVYLYLLFCSMSLSLHSLNCSLSSWHDSSRLLPLLCLVFFSTRTFFFSKKLGLSVDDFLKNWYRKTMDYLSRLDVTVALARLNKNNRLHNTDRAPCTFSSHKNS